MIEKIKIDEMIFKLVDENAYITINELAEKIGKLFTNI